MTRGHDPLDDELALTRMDANASDDVIAAAGIDGVERAERAGCFPLALGRAGDAARAAAAGIDDERWRAEVYGRHADEVHWLLRVALVEAELRACAVAVGVTGSIGGRRPSCSPAVCRTPFAATVMAHHADPRALRRYQEVVDEHKQDAATRMDTLLGGTRGRQR